MGLKYTQIQGHLSADQKTLGRCAEELYQHHSPPADLISYPGQNRENRTQELCLQHRSRRIQVFPMRTRATIGSTYSAVLPEFEKLKGKCETNLTRLLGTPGHAKKAYIHDRHRRIDTIRTRQASSSGGNRRKTFTGELRAEDSW